LTEKGRKGKEKGQKWKAVKWIKNREELRQKGHNMQCCGSGMLILDPDFFPLPSRIPDPTKKAEGKK
jgi:hypothetical protein